MYRLDGTVKTALQDTVEFLKRLSAIWNEDQLTDKVAQLSYGVAIEQIERVIKWIDEGIVK